ncbi:MAG TPA: transposase [Candidatus Binatia bacterium]|nr:transposase [Candidatus Binatia bacterium]
MPLQELTTQYARLRQELPAESAQLARECHAFQRARVLESPEDLLYLVLLYSIGELSLREVAGVCVGSGKPLTDEAVRQRLGACPQWVEGLVGKLLPTTRLPQRSEGQWQLVICDGSQLSGPGASGTDYRWHVAYDPVAQQSRELHVTDVHTGESLTRFAWRPGMVVLGDRNFAKAPALVATHRQGAHVVVRMTPQYLQLWTPESRAFELVAALRAAGAQRHVSFALQVRDEPQGEELAVWIHALHLNEQGCNRARRRAKRQARRRGRTPRAQTLFLSEWVLVLTTLSPQELGAEDILELYRIRGQVELVIKRYKSLLGAAHLRAKRGSPLALVYLGGKLLFALLVERRALARLGNVGTQMRGVRQATWWRIWKLIATEVQEAVPHTARWSAWEWHAVLRALAERTRQRQLQVVPAAVAAWLRSTPLVPLQQAA